MHPLEQQVCSVARRARLVRAVGGVVKAGSCIVAAVFLIALFDVVLRVEDRGLRLIESAAALLAIGASIYFLLLPALRKSASNLATAQRIEKRFPELAGRLSSSLAFLRQNEEDGLCRFSDPAKSGCGRSRRSNRPPRSQVRGRRQSRAIGNRACFLRRSRGAGGRIDPTGDLRLRTQPIGNSVACATLAANQSTRL